MQRNKVKMKVNIDEKVKPLYVDRFRIQTALMNLIQNALEAMPQGGKITVSAQNLSPKNFESITVSDTGAGMTTDMVEKVCEPFFSTRQDEGLRGLGLAIVRDIIKVHGGTMEIKSAPGQGTSVILTLPIAQQDNAPHI
jgi:signal transduction histidine kinase